MNKVPPNSKPQELLYLPVETKSGVEYAVIPRNMSEEAFSFLIKALDFYKDNCPGFIVGEEQAAPEPDPGKETRP